MEKTIIALKKEFSTLRAGRANPQILDKIMVDYYGTQTPLKQMGNISAPEPRLLTINLWDTKAIPLVEKAILKSDLGLNPSNDGKVIRLVVPELNEEGGDTSGFEAIAEEIRREQKNTKRKRWMKRISSISVPCCRR